MSKVSEMPDHFVPGVVDGQRALEEVRKFTAISPRDSGTEGAGKAAEYLSARLRALGLAVEVDEFRDSSPRGETVFRNVMARIPGSTARTIVLGSHYDTKSGIASDFQGANDSGSSTGILLELASALRGGPVPPAEIMFVFFDGEECMRSYTGADGLHGSRHLARRLAKEGRSRDVMAVIVLDMIGDRDLSVTIPRNSTPALCSAVFAAAEAEGARSKFSLAAGAIIDDHQPFFDQGIPAVDIIDLEFGSAPGRNDYWHTAQDTIDKLSADSLGTVGKVTVRVLNSLLHP